MELIDEEWRDIAEWEMLYQISDVGRIRSLDRLIEIPGRSPYVRPGRVMSLTANKDGHLYVDLTRNSVHHRRFAHILVCEAWHGPRPPGLLACHINGQPSDNRPDNLYWGTYRQNWEDSVRHGTASYGVRVNG